MYGDQKALCLSGLGFPSSSVAAFSFTFVPSRRFPSQSLWSALCFVGPPSYRRWKEHDDVFAEESNFYFRESYLGRGKAAFSGNFKLCLNVWVEWSTCMDSSFFGHSDKYKSRDNEVSGFCGPVHAWCCRLFKKQADKRGDSHLRQIMVFCLRQF